MVELLQAILIFNYNDHYTIYNNFLRKKRTIDQLLIVFVRKKCLISWGRIIVFFRGYGTYFKGFFSCKEELVIAHYYKFHDILLWENRTLCTDYFGEKEVLTLFLYLS